VNRLTEHWPLFLILGLSLALGLAMWSHQSPKRKTVRPENQVEAERRQLDEDFRAMHAPPTTKRSP
jgi:hypothetical protein